MMTPSPPVTTILHGNGHESDMFQRGGRPLCHNCAREAVAEPAARFATE
jgi:hypothetical protein